jgi:hypothetical protein
MVGGAVNRAIAPELEDAFLGDQRESATNRVTQPGRLSDEEDFAQATFTPPPGSGDDQGRSSFMPVFSVFAGSAGLPSGKIRRP